MAYKFNEKAREYTISGFQDGIAPSPHTGIGDIKCANINSIPGEAQSSFVRVPQLPVINNATISANSSNSVLYTTGGNPLIVGSVITFSSSSISNLSTGVKYWVIAVTGTTVQTVQLTATYNGTIVTGLGLSGTAAFSTFGIAKFVGKAREYVLSSDSYRYYWVDVNSEVWVNDPNVYGVFSPTGNVAVANNARTTGIGVTCGCVFVFTDNQVNWKFTNRIGVDSGTSWNGTGTYLNASNVSHTCISTTDKNGSLIYTDGSYLGQISINAAAPGLGTQFSLVLGTSNGTTTVTETRLEQGVELVNGLPVTVYLPQGGSMPGGVSEGTQYYVVNVGYAGSGSTTFGLAATLGGSAISILSGTFYITSFYPPLATTFTQTRQLMELSNNEVATCLAPISTGTNFVLAIGTKSNAIYQWQEGDATAFSVLYLPEYNTQSLLNVNNMIYIFAGNKGSIFIMNGSSLGTIGKIPDYVANTDGTNPYPYFTWYDAAFIQSRVLCGIQDQTNTHSGNCGGIWSFTPTQNILPELDTINDLHIENQNSYGTYNGYCNLLQPNSVQQTRGPQYFSTWVSDISNPTYSIDVSSTSPYSAGAASGQMLIDTDIIPIGTFAERGTLANIEYKLARPLKTGESIEILWRGDLASAFQDIGPGPGGAGIDNTPGALSYLYPTSIPITGLQWLQLRIQTTCIQTSSSLVPLTELRIRV